MGKNHRIGNISTQHTAPPLKRRLPFVGYPIHEDFLHKRALTSHALHLSTPSSTRRRQALPRAQSSSEKLAIHPRDATHHSSRVPSPFYTYPSRNDVTRLLHFIFVADTSSSCCGYGAGLLCIPAILVTRTVLFIRQDCHRGWTPRWSDRIFRMS
jgi:hypothetical protein